MASGNYDCIYVPGGGLLENGCLPPWTVARLEKALEIEEQADWIVPLSGGTVHKPPPLDPEGYPVFESRAAAAYLVAAGISPARILTEICSYDTIGNAYFARTLFSDPMKIARILVISSAFHLARVEAAFRWVYSLIPLRQDYSLRFLSVPDNGLSSEPLRARQEREKKGLANLEKLAGKISTLADFQDWLYREHSAYAVTGAREELSQDELKSY